MKSTLEFKKVEARSMSDLIPYFGYESGRSCDISFGGILMWTPLCDYEYAVKDNTLFVKGYLPYNRDSVCFFRPLGELSLSDAIQLLRMYCDDNGIPLIFAPVPEYYLDEFLGSFPDMSYSKLDNLTDYIYDSVPLATLSGKKMSKKRNHVNQFKSEYPDWICEWIDADNLTEILKIYDELTSSVNNSEDALKERELTRRYLESFSEYSGSVKGLLLKAGGEIVAFSMGDLRGDTFFVQVEKARRDVNGASEMINNCFVKYIMEEVKPDLKYVNREDDAGNEGLRKAKLSYHPVELLEKYWVSL